MKIYSGADGTEILLIRPGATEFDESGRIIGTLDVPLSDLGKQQAADLAADSADYDVKAILCSPSLAAQQTAKFLEEKHGRKIKIKKALCNIDMGLWQGKELDELRATQPKVAKQWEEHPETVCPPEGESFDDVIPRVQKFLRKLQKKHKSGTIMIVVADPLAKVIASLLTNGIETETEKETVTAKGDLSDAFEACGKMDLLPLTVEAADA